MPVRVNLTETMPDRDEFVSRLAAELSSPNPSALAQPLVLVHTTLATRTARVTVVWDDWARVPDALRTDIILDAFARAYPDGYDFEITIALGVTFSEGVDAGLLPYEVVSLRRSGDQIPVDAYRAAAEQLLIPSSVTSDGRVRLHFAEIEDAKSAVDELTRILPGSEWAVVRYAEPMTSF
jgi:hypothetical protein